MTTNVNVLSWIEPQAPNQGTFQIKNENFQVPVLGKHPLGELIHETNFLACLPIVHVVAAIAKFILGGICLYRGNTTLGLALIGVGILDLFWPVCLVAHAVATAVEWRRQHT